MKYDARLGIAAHPPRLEQRADHATARHVDALLTRFERDEIGHETIAHALIDAGVSLSRVATLVANPKARRHT